MPNPTTTALALAAAIGLAPQSAVLADTPPCRSMAYDGNALPSFIRGKFYGTISWRR